MKKLRPHNMESPRLNTEDDFRSLFELSAVGAAQVSPEGRYVRVNQKFCQMLGYSEQELLERTVLDVTHPDDRKASAVVLNSSFTGEPDEYSVEKRYVRKDGETVWALVKWRVLRDENGNALHTVANAEDITARKHAEVALRAREAQLRAIIDNSSAFIFVKDLEGRYLKVNRWYELVRGLSEAEMMGKTDYDLYPKEVADGVHKNDKAVLAANKPIQFEEQVPFSDGVHHFVSVKFPLSGGDGKPYAVCGIATDITERRKVEQALQVADERLRLAMEAGAIGTFDWNLRTNEVFWSEPSIATFGTPSGVSQGVYHDWAKRLDPEDLQAIEIRFQEVLKNKGQHWLAEYRLASDGTTRQRWVRTQGHIFYDGQGEPARMIGANIDISDRKQAEAVERQARRQAEEANRMKDEFLALVSHELRSPLNAMLGYARLLRYGPVDELKVGRMVDVIERNGKAQIQLIEDLLDTARIISGKLQLVVGPVNVVSVIEGAVQTLYPAADARDIKIQTDLNPNVGQITGDTVRLQQVIWNLLSNSVKFTPRGGFIDIRLERIDPHICITVSDTGKGIRSDFLPYVFDRFRQADASSTRRYGGLGIGLALVKYLVELHGGTVEAFSAGENKGATFTVLLPVRAVSSPLEAQGAPVSSLEPRKLTLAGVRALVVDDEEDARELLKAVLAQFGADVVAASSAAEAFALMTTARNDKRPDVIVSDLGMPEEDGFGLLQRVRNWERGHKVYTPAIALTAFGRSEDRLRALIAGFQMHVPKPVEPNELAIVVASVVNRGNGA
jgi:PAS domain S-box-containing protein